MFLFQDHFTRFGSPIMMGGDADCSSKGIFGAARDASDGGSGLLLVVDPHYYGKKAANERLWGRGWVKWVRLSEFMDSSFYNLCLPQVKYVRRKK